MDKYIYKQLGKINNPKVFWEDCVLSFMCPHCKEKVIVDSQDEPTECECGIRYGLVTYVARYEIDWDATHAELREG